ncbi:MAG: DUF3458 domain-containing protein, partial [Thiotrichaceae bacterium]|nr:DUF3458 domain-containing protein [Thiotrichaceae bacterium]
GDDGFRKGSDLYFQRHDGQAVTCDDFVNAMEAANDFDLELFRRWYSQAGTPVLEVLEEYSQQDKTYILTLKQSCAATPGQQRKESLHIPVKLGLLSADGSVATICINGCEPCTEIIVELKEQQQTFVFEKLDEKPVVSLLRGFSAPVNLKMQQSLDELAFLLSYDTDTFNRWEAGQKMSGKIIFGLIEDLQQGRDMQLNSCLVEAYKNVLEQPWDDLSYFSLLLSLPEENYLAGQMEVIDVEAIHQAREFVKRSLAEQLQDQFQRLYDRYHKDESGQFDAGAIGRRRIKNICLSYLAKLESEESYQLAEKQFESAANMTDQMTALAVIVDSGNPAKQSCLQGFYQQWQNEALVVDKWF